MQSVFFEVAIHRYVEHRWVPLEIESRAFKTLPSKISSAPLGQYLLKAPTLRKKVRERLADQELR
jgi:hypothetical protein